MADHIVNARYQQKIDTTGNWHALNAMVLKAGELGVEKKPVGDGVAY